MHGCNVKIGERRRRFRRQVAIGAGRVVDVCNAPTPLLLKPNRHGPIPLNLEGGPLIVSAKFVSIKLYTASVQWKIPGKIVRELLSVRSSLILTGKRESKSVYSSHYSSTSSIISCLVLGSSSYNSKRTNGY